MEPYEQYKHTPQWRGWIIIFCFSASIIGWGLLIHHLVPDSPRQWDFAALPDAPSESIYTTDEPPEAHNENPPRQIETLPEITPLHPTDNAPREGTP